MNIEVCYNILFPQNAINRVEIYLFSHNMTCLYTVNVLHICLLEDRQLKNLKLFKNIFNYANIKICIGYHKPRSLFLILSRIVLWDLLLFSLSPTFRTDALQQLQLWMKEAGHVSHQCLSRQFRTLGSGKYGAQS